MNLLPYKTVLDTAALGPRCFVNHLPATFEVAFMLRNKLAGAPINHEIPGYYQTGFQLIVRHHDDVLGYQLAQDAADALTFQERLLNPNLNVRYCRARHLPVAYAVSEGDLTEFSVNFDVCFDILP